MTRSALGQLNIGDKIVLVDQHQREMAFRLISTVCFGGKCYAVLCDDDPLRSPRFTIVRSTKDEHGIPCLVPVRDPAECQAVLAALEKSVA